MILVELSPGKSLPRIIRAERNANIIIAAQTTHIVLPSDSMVRPIRLDRPTHSCRTDAEEAATRPGMPIRLQVNRPRPPRASARRLRPLRAPMGRPILVRALQVRLVRERQQAWHLRQPHHRLVDYPAGLRLVLASALVSVQLLRWLLSQCGSTVGAARVRQARRTINRRTNHSSTVRLLGLDKRSSMVRVVLSLNFLVGIHIKPGRADNGTKEHSMSYRPRLERTSYLGYR